MPMLGMGSASAGLFPWCPTQEWRALLVMGVGACVGSVLPDRRCDIWIVTGFVTWFVRNPYFSVALVCATLIIGLFRRNALRALGAVIVVCLMMPKVWRSLTLNEPWRHAWLDQTGTTLLLLATLYYLREQHDQRVIGWRVKDWVAFVLFPSNALNPINIAPSHLDSLRAANACISGGFRALGLAAAKGLGLVIIYQVCAHFWYSRWSQEDFLTFMTTLSWWKIWGCLFVTHIACVLWLSGTADVAVAIARFHGLSLPYNYRWALLAWNPVELWRRWAIYNRRFLLKTVYFPAGGRNRHQLRNILLTFLTSAVLLHSGWFGSRFWVVGGDMLLLFCAYFLLQGIAVCACVVWWRWCGKDPSSDRELRLTYGRVITTLLTQGFAAWIHVLILAPSGVPWTARLAFMREAFGL